MGAKNEASPWMGAPCSPKCKVPGHPLHFVSRHSLQFWLIDQPQRGRESGKRCAFSKAAVPPSFSSSRSLADPTIQQNRFAGIQIEFPNDRVAVIDQNAVIERDDLHRLLAECATEMPLPAVKLELAVGIHLA